MKQVKLVIAALVIGTLAFASCKKDYTCTCTTTIGGISTTTTYDLRNQRLHDADEACDRLENDANSMNGAATTNCHL